jgi:hypothetical protein
MAHAALDRRDEVRGAGLTPSQKESWDRDGYLVLPQFFGAEIVDPINVLIDQLADPKKRPPGLAERVVVDTLTDGATKKRMRLADAPAEAFRSPVKFNDLFLECEIVRACNMHPRLVPILDGLLDGAPAACNSLNFIQGSEQTAHVDSWFMPPPVPEKMVVTSVCLEDVRADAGPLFYYPGSQKIPPYRFSNGGIRAVDAEMPACHAYLHAEMGKRSLSRETFLGKKGDVFIWSCQIAHGGTPIANPASTRRSLVTHYWRARDMARRKLQPYGDAFYFVRDHQPLPDEPAWKRIAGRAGLELRWAGRGLKQAVIRPAH